MTAFFRRMRGRGRSLAWIARGLGLSPRQCIRRAEALGLVRGKTQPPLPPAGAEPVPLGPPRTLLEEGVCRWIHGEPRDAQWRMCGHPSVHGSSWCAHHFVRCAARGRR
jgi:hypothetical protein